MLGNIKAADIHAVWVFSVVYMSCRDRRSLYSMCVVSLFLSLSEGLLNSSKHFWYPLHEISVIHLGISKPLFIISQYVFAFRFDLLNVHSKSFDKWTMDTEWSSEFWDTFPNNELLLTLKHEAYLLEIFLIHLNKHVHREILRNVTDPLLISYAGDLTSLWY